MRRLIKTILLLIGACGVPLLTAAPCIVSIYPHDETGLRIAAVITAATYLPDEGSSTVDPKLRNAPIQILRSRLILPVEPDPAQRIRVEMKGKDGKSIVEFLEFLHCGQRHSFSKGLAEEGNGEGYSAVSGRLTGCPEYRNWWVRMMPMFSFSDLTPIPEADVDGKSGRFQLLGFITGIRHIIVVGVGKEAVHAVAVNVVGGGAVEAPTVNVSGKCHLADPGR